MVSVVTSAEISAVSQEVPKKQFAEGVLQARLHEGRVTVERTIDTVLSSHRPFLPDFPLLARRQDEFIASTIFSRLKPQTLSHVSP